MESEMKITNRKKKILTAVSYNIYGLSQLAEIYFTNKKKAAEAMKKLFDTGLVNRTFNPMHNSKGKPEYLYFLAGKGKKELERNFGVRVDATINPLRNVFSIPHRLLISDFHVSSACNAPDGFKARFLYPKQVHLTAELMNGLISDGIFTVERQETGKQLLHFLEADMGSESIAGRSAYSLEHKLGKYAECFDSINIQEGINSALGYEFQGFRVLVVAESVTRIENIKALTKKLKAEFVWFALGWDIREKRIYKRVWSNYLYTNLSLLEPYPPRDLDGDFAGDQTPARVL